MKSCIVRSLLLLALVLSARPLFAQSSTDSLPALVGLLSSSADEGLRLDVLRGMKAGLQGRRGVAMPAGWAELEPKLLENQSAEVRLLSQSLGLTFGSERALSALRLIFLDSKADVGARRSALEGLLSVKDPQLTGALKQVLGDTAIRPEAIRAMASFNDPATPAVLLGVYSKLNLGERRDALNTLASRQAFAQPLVEAMRSGQIPPSHLTADLVRQIKNLKDTRLNSDLETLWGVTRETSADMKNEIERYRKIYRAGGSTPGNASRGRKVFARICQQCHTLFDTGGKVGPDLTGSNRADLDYILSNIVDPNSVIPNDYRTSTVELKDDRVLTGIVRQQDDKTVTVATANETLLLPRGDVRSLQLSELSMMPEGLMAQLTDEEVRDLIYYLGRPGQVP
ncbi:MAG: c-type cytochrome [Verrucomicrobiales bacterium]|nr:c-type cytochrome [Verrucomicrobiales bacterium]